MTMILDGSNGLTMPTWTTANRPTSPIIGAQGYNTTYGGVEVYNGSAWDLITGGPAFSAWLSSGQNITSSTQTKMQCSTKEFDTNNCYDNTTNYRFTPTVPGYYQVNAATYPNTTTTFGMTSIYKNGSQFKAVQIVQNNVGCEVSALVYLNGTTDYIEMYGYYTGTTPQVYAAQVYTWFQAVYVRGQ